MSYRAFKRLLGETSLERKCRFLFGAAIWVLITLSFFFYATQTEELAYKQAVNTCRLLVNSVVAEKHIGHLKSKDFSNFDGKFIEQAWRLQHSRSGIDSDVLTDSEITDPAERDLFKEFSKKDDPKDEEHRLLSGDRLLVFYSAVRAGKSCLVCHQAIAQKFQRPVLAENELMAMVRIKMKTDEMVTAVHVNRAFLISIGLVTALLIMAGSWIIVRYVIVKPVKHLKEVSDAISAGQLNLRSEIQTGDEFEDLSHAFNRMLRNLISMQDRMQSVNADLDRKVDELAQANMALYESNRLKSDFLATMSHELRTPLNSILGFSDVLTTSNGLNDKQHRWVGNIKSSGQRLLNLINDILDLAKIEAGKMHVHIEEFNLPDICDGMLNMFRPLAEKKNIDLRGQIPPDIPVLRQDKTKLQQILQNLLSNAIKFTPEGGRVLLKAETQGLYLLLIVNDTGVGIAPEEQELVFEKFRQSGNPLTREHAGTGLGLSIVRELSKLLGGEVFLNSELGRGSTFTVRLPLQLTEEPKLDFDLSHERIDLSKAQRIDVRLYSSPSSSQTKLDVKKETTLELDPSSDSPTSLNEPGTHTPDSSPPL